MKTIGVLNLQGAVSEHFDMMKIAIERTNLDFEIKSVRYAEEVANCDGIIISGGESTVIGKLIAERGIGEVIKNQNIPIFGTCAGMVLMAKKVDYDQPILNLMDYEVKRNAFGSQKDSFEKEIEILGDKFQGVFIRAPAIEKVYNVDSSNSSKIEILSEIDNKIIAIKQGKNIALSFHPELTNDTRLHEYYLREVL
ncbi:pyridoxal 5'-phosphate synthase glutaminase subunit PdxT [Methanobrevibacter filiformis]|uniref:Pyridoxal 5'-phosphate synthase subunit PdxT n=1 Tax=Methanobrevibacter filiformis TaxID=55758 RepID=A0A166D9S2_9EURY|nr:pyridoxal 5'-phosphate synthase glutaminase subunit PdxT [Methanobrevibacter filiformis]KZX15354.1 glutamine amidotransferase subunit PdxT [Methanobrevibacter filiformis]